ncbi:MAG: extracellular solute-binding protein, partial [Caldilineaceae bacterium]|nr:extracellular solute-binding protein [Caldilineaceae bacterium]
MLYKRSWLLALLLVTALVFAACAAPVAAPSGDSGAAMETAGGDGEMAAEGDMAMDWENVDPSGQTVTFWHQHTQEREEALNDIVSRFNENNEWGIEVVAEYQGGYGDIFNKMLNVLNTNEAPNLVVAYQNQAATYQLADALLDMNSLVDSAKWGLSEDDKADFFPGFYNSDVFPSFGNARLGFPPNRSMEVMYYNADWLAELGYDAPPATPDEFKEMACAAVQNPFSAGVGDAPSMGYQLSIDASRAASWAFAFGGDVFDYENNMFTYDSDASKAAMSFLQDLFDSGCAAIVAENYGDQTDFGNGRLLFTVGSSSGLPFYDSAVSEGAGFNWSIAPLPHTTADPVDPETVYVNNLDFYKSTDGGKTFFEIPTPHGDNHDVWIDPANNNRMIQGNDGGANVTVNGGFTWSSIFNQPTSQFYHLAVDNKEPYNVYGTQQDNSSIATPSANNHASISWQHVWIAGTGESGYIQVDPLNEDVVYVGAIGSSPGGGNSLQRYDRKTDDIRLVTSWPEVNTGIGAGEWKQRFAWTYPIHFSPHDPKTIYIGGDRVF